MKKDWIYLDTYVLQQDMRIRLPKSILTNIYAIKGRTKFDIFFDKDDDCLILKEAKSEEKEN